jgi:hypothetical protein
MEQYLVSADQTANITLWDIERMSEMSTMKEDYEISDTLFLQEVRFPLHCIVQVHCVCSIGEDWRRQDLYLGLRELQEDQGVVR